jgi:hypothetical protein
MDGHDGTFLSMDDAVYISVLAKMNEYIPKRGQTNTRLKGEDEKECPMGRTPL